MCLLRAAWAACLAAASRRYPPALQLCLLHSTVGHASMSTHFPCTLAAEAWFERHGLPCPPGTAIAEHMLKVASDAADTQRLLECFAQESDLGVAKPAGTVSPFAAAAGHRRTVSNASSRGESEVRQAIGKSPFESPAAVPEGLPLPGTHRHRLSTGGSSEMSEALGHTAAGKAGPAPAPHQHRRGWAGMGGARLVLACLFS